MRIFAVLLAVLMQVSLWGAPVLAAAYDPTVIRISMEEGFWDKYHMINSATTGADVEKVYKVKKVEVRLLAGDKEFGNHTFTPEDSKPQKFELLHGAATALTIRIRATGAENSLWICAYPYKYAGDDIVIKALPTTITIHYPGL